MYFGCGCPVSALQCIQRAAELASAHCMHLGPLAAAGPDVQTGGPVQAGLAFISRLQ